MSNMFFPHFPLTLFFFYCLFFSFSYAHYKSHETPQCNCYCSSAHNNSHENIPANPGQSFPAHNNSHKNIPTNPSHSSPAHNNSHENIPTKPGNSSPENDNSHEVPAKPGNSFPAHNNSQEVPAKPPIGCLPLHISLCPVKAALDHMGCAAAVNAAVMMHNQILQRGLERFRSLYPHCHILYADYWNAYLTIKMNLQKYQFEEPFKPCCGAAGHFDLHSLCGSPGTVKCNDPSKFISWDGIHLTEAMNRKVTDLFLNQGFCQPSFSELVKSKSGM